MHAFNKLVGRPSLIAVSEFLVFSPGDLHFKYIIALDCFNHLPAAPHLLRLKVIKY
jgi:hypothetical protein